MDLNKLKRQIRGKNGNNGSQKGKNIDIFYKSLKLLLSTIIVVLTTILFALYGQNLLPFFPNLFFLCIFYFSGYFLIIKIFFKKLFKHNLSDRRIIKQILLPYLIATLTVYLIYIIQILHSAYENNIKFPWQQ